MTTYAVGSLVKTRGREWVVLPDSNRDWLMLRPLGGSDYEKAGVYLPLEGDDVQPATFDHPDPQQVGNFRSSRLLRDAVRLGFRSSAGPFRSFARIYVEPRPYQLVPLLMALKLDPVRLLIADDVGIGKTIEAGLITRELLDRGEIQRMAVLCPPHLAEQWQRELAEKFHIQAVLVLASTAARLERTLGSLTESIFDRYPFVIVSTEYIKSQKRRAEFLRTCPEFVIVDEAHTCAYSAGERGGRHLRHQLVKELAADEQRHLVLVTATPHSGKEGAFRSLLGLLRPEFATLPEDLSGRENERTRREIAQHLIQRRRADIRAYMEEETEFPEREEAEESYTLHKAYKQFFDDVLDYARERVLDPIDDQRRKRVRWWSALALLRSLGSSPAAAAATLRMRSSTADTETVSEADSVGENTVLDLDDGDTAELIDISPGGQDGEEEHEQAGQNRARLLRLARRADELRGPKHDAKLVKAIALAKKLLADKYSPIFFCRFITTADYLAEELRRALPNKVEITAVTGNLPPAERELRVQQMGEHPQRILVATDCLSEGINLQQYFDAVVHYDLSWNPTRHEQREGRVDRYGQPAPIVRAVTYYGLDNHIDGIVLDVLLRKHKQIRTSLGISVPLPTNTTDVVQALLNGLLIRGSQVAPQQIALPFLHEQATAASLELEWDNVSQREKRSRTLFAQQTIDVQDVLREWQAVREAIGTAVDVQRFITELVEAHGGSVSEKNGRVRLILPPDQALREAASMNPGSLPERLHTRFQLPVDDDTLYLSRTHPIVERLAAYTMDSALDPLTESIARRCGVIRTTAVDKRHTLLLLRYRYHIITRATGQPPVPLLAEACAMLGFRGRGLVPADWLSSEEVEQMLTAPPSQNIDHSQAVAQIERTLTLLPDLTPYLNELVQTQGEALLDAHQRVRAAARAKNVRYTIEPQLPPDVLGVYVLLPDLAQ